MNIKIKKVAIFFICAILTIIPFYNIIIAGVYKWHVTQPEFIQGGIELIICGMLMILGWYLFGKKHLVPIVFFSSVYLSLNGVILPVAVDLLYFAIILYCGVVFANVRQNRRCDDLIVCFIQGISIWGAGAIILSLLGKGTINALRIYTVVLFFVALFLGQKKVDGILIEKKEKFLNMRIKSIYEMISLTILCLIVLALFAKTNTAQDYDSLWYGLRPEYVLVGENSFYNQLGYGSFVYYYPKLVELFYLPLSGMGDYSFLQGANIIVFCGLLYVIKQYIKNHFVYMDNGILMMFMAMIASIPALANISATAKPDIFGAFFVMTAFYLGNQYFQKNEFFYLIYAGISLLLCTGTKLTYILWGGILFVWVFILLLMNKKNLSVQQGLNIIKSEVVVLLSSIIFVGGVHFRTFLLTGYPIYPVGINIWNRLGFKGKSHVLNDRTVSLSNSCSFRNVIERLYEFIFNPNALEHVIMLWTSNVVLICIVLYLFFSKKKKNVRDILLGILMFVVMVYYMVSMTTPDGNYFVIPIIIIALLSLKNTENLLEKHKKNIFTLFAFIVLIQLPIMFVSHSSWAWGTKCFSSEIIVDNIDTVKTNSNIFNYSGISLIQNEVSNYNQDDRVISSGDNNGVCFRLSCAVETFSELSSSKLSSYKNVESYDAFKSYLEYIDVKALVLLNIDETVFRNYVQQYVSERGCINIIEDQEGICYVIR